VKTRDRGVSNEAGRIRFTSAILPRWARRSKRLDALLPVLYLRGVLIPIEAAHQNGMMSPVITR